MQPLRIAGVYNGMSNSHWPRNRLLLALPARNLKRLVPDLETSPANASKS